MAEDTQKHSRTKPNMEAGTLPKNNRKEKRKALLEKAKQPIPPLPVRELSEYEKIRENIISQQKKEWELYEKEWENQWLACKEKK